MKRHYDFGLVRPLADELKAHLRIVGSDLDGQIRQALLGSVESCEKYIGEVIVRSDFTLTSSFSSIVPLKAPVAEVAGVKVDGMTTDRWTLNGNRIVFFEDVTGRNVEVRYTSGWEDMPFDVKAAVFLRASTLFEQANDRVQEKQNASDTLLRPYRKWEVR